MAKQIFTTGEIPWKSGDYGIASYRIEVDITDKHHPLQRHIWTYASGEVRKDEWIRGISDTPEQLIASGFTRVTTKPRAA